MRGSLSKFISSDDVGLGLRTMGKMKTCWSSKADEGFTILDGEDPGGSAHQPDVLALQYMNGFKGISEYSTQWSKHLQNSVNDTKPNHWDRGY